MSKAGTSTTNNEIRSGSRKARILIVDDHPLVRRGLRELMDHEPDLEICGEAADADDALQSVESLGPDLVVIDITLKSGHGIELIQKIKAGYRGVKMLVSSMHDESIYAERSLQAGAMGYISKQEDPDQVVEAVRQVLAGKVYLSPSMTEHILGRAVHGDLDLEKPLVESLSNRELEVFELIGKGQTTREISEVLRLSVKTIETYRENIKTKLGLKTGAELTRRAVQWVLENI